MAALLTRRAHMPPPLTQHPKVLREINQCMILVLDYSESAQSDNPYDQTSLKLERLDEDIKLAIVGL